MMVQVKIVGVCAGGGHICIEFAGDMSYKVTVPVGELIGTEPLNTDDPVLTILRSKCIEAGATTFNEIKTVIGGVKIWL